jgi:leucyl-tRNA synthetase
LINQGKITGDSRFVYRLSYSHAEFTNDQLPQIFISKTVRDRMLKGESFREITERILSFLTIKSVEVDGNIGVTTTRPDSLNDGLHTDISIVDGLVLDTAAFKKWKPDFANAEFIFEDAEGNPTTDPVNGKYICGSAIEKMSKSYFNVVNPDQIIDNYGADTLRMYEMFLGPLEASKPWSTQGIDGVFKFLRKVWNLIHDQSGNLKVSDAEPTREELKVLHKTIKKVEQDIENFSFNTSVSEFMICVNELGSLKCNKRAIVEPLVIALSPFAPHIAEELWEKLGHSESILTATYPKYDDQYLVESTFSYPISINGKVRAQMEFALDMPKEDIEKIVLASEIVQKWTEGKPPKKMIVVPGRIVNVVL